MSSSLTIPSPVRSNSGSFVPATISTTNASMSSISQPPSSSKLQSTVVDALLQRCELPLEKSVSATTRDARPGEKPGEDYHFLKIEEFQRRKKAGDFLECEEPYGNGVWYGTLKATVASGLNAGKWVLLEIEVDGALNAMSQHPEAISIFLLPESKEILYERLRGRATESQEERQNRLARADYELSKAEHYRHQVVNRTVNQAVEDICQILNTYATQMQGQTKP